MTIDNGTVFRDIVDNVTSCNKINKKMMEVVILASEYHRLLNLKGSDIFMDKMSDIMRNFTFKDALTDESYNLILRAEKYLLVAVDYLENKP